MRLYIGIIVVSVLVSCSRSVNDDELWMQQVEIGNGMYVELVHNSRCRHKPTWNDRIIKKLDFYQYKYTLFDSCIRDEEAKAIAKIGAYNNSIIKNAVMDGRLEITDDNERAHYRRELNAFGNGEPIYETRYVLQGDMNIVEIDSTINFLDAVFKVYGKIVDF